MYGFHTEYAALYVYHPQIIYPFVVFGSPAHQICEISVRLPRPLDTLKHESFDANAIAVTL